MPEKSQLPQCYAQTLPHLNPPPPCVVSFKGETSVGQAVPLRGMFTAILQVRKLVWRQDNAEDPFLPSLIVHLPLLMVTSECNSKP